MPVRVSVIVPTYRRPALLERCLKALLLQDLPPTEYEIIVVDDAASIETKRQVEGWARRGAGQCVYYLPVPGAEQPHGPAAARNLGWRAAQGQIIAFTDDDCIPAHDWLRAGLTCFVGDVAAVSGHIVVPLEGVPTDYERNAALLEQSEFATANSFYRRAVLEEVGGFDERFTAAWREDSDLFFTLLERGATCVFSRQPVVLHPVRQARWGISLFQQLKSMYNALLYKKHPHLYRERIQAAPPWRYYCIVGLLLLLLLSIILALPWSTLAASCGWLVLTGQFCMQRLYATSRAPGHVLEMIVTSALIPPVTVFWRLCGMVRYRVLFL